MKILFTGDAYLAEKIVLSPCILEKINASDFLVVNLEGVVTDVNASRNDKASSFRIDINDVIELQNQIEAELILFLCNNHMLDFGEQGLKDCISTLKKHGFKYILNELVLEKGSDRVVIQGYTADEPSVMSIMESGVHEFSNYYDASVLPIDGNRIAICHWGDEYVCVPHYRIVESAKRLSTSFDLIVGHHPHVIQGVERFGSVDVFFSLGNFYLKGFTYKNGAVHVFPKECYLGIIVQYDSLSKESQVFGITYNELKGSVSLSEDAFSLFSERSKYLDGDIKASHIKWERSYYEYLQFKNSFIINVRSVWPKYKGRLCNFLKKILDF